MQEIRPFCGFATWTDAPCTRRLTNIQDLSISRKALIWRFLRKEPGDVELLSNQYNMICLDHKDMYLYVFEHNFTRRCQDPMQIHKTNVRGKITTLSEEEAILINTINPKMKMIPGYGLCARCKATYIPKIVNQLGPIVEESIGLTLSQISEASVSSVESIPSSNEVIPKYQKFLEMMDACYDQIKKIPTKTHHGDEQRVQEGLKLLRNLQAQTEELLGIKSSEECIDCTANMDILSKAIPEANSKKEVINLASLAPSSWKKEEVCERLSIGSGTLRAARVIRETRCFQKMGSSVSKNHLPNHVKEQVRKFYFDTDVSVASPSATVTIKDQNTKEKTVLPKHFLLRRIDEVFIEFKEKFPGLKIGRSSFYNLRPVNVTIPNEKDISSCLCLYHSNMNLILQPLNMSHNDALSLVVCDPTSRTCMNLECNECPGLKNLHEYILGVIDLEKTDFIYYQEWKYLNKFAEIVSTKMDAPTYIDLVIEQFKAFMPHHFTYKSQKTFFENCKENLTPEKPVIITDFGENYSFVVRDQIQGFHFNNTTPCTICPFVIYYKKPNDNTVHHLSFLIISDTNQHDTYSFHVFRCKILDYLKENFPYFKEIQYFSDGCSGQYKNFKNFSLLCRHDKEFHLKAHWHFFATSHGKNACDSITGIVKKNARMYSLKNAYDKQIQTPVDLYRFCQNNLQKIVTIFVHDDEVKDAKENLDAYFQQFQSIKGTQGFHSFSPISLDTLTASKLSDGHDSCERKFSKKNVVVQYPKNT